MDRNQESSSPGLGINDVYYVLFRHKWMIIFFTLLGLAGAAAVYVLFPQLYKSEAKVLIRYIVERKSMTSPEGEAQVKSPNTRADSILNSELQILSSFDLMQRVAETIGPEKILGAPNVESAPLKAAGAVARGFQLEVPPQSSIIHITFIHPNESIVRPVVQELISNYLKKHNEIHLELGEVNEFIRQQTDQLRPRIAQTEEELRRIKSEAGIISVTETRQAYISEISKIRQELNLARAELDQHKAVLKGLVSETNEVDEAEAPEIAKDLLEEYTSQRAQLDALLRTETQLLTRYTEKNPEVIRYQKYIEDKRQLLRDMEAQTPQLAGFSLSLGGTNRSMMVSLETSQIVALEAKIQSLTNMLAEVHADAVKLDEIAATITDLERKKEADETKYKFYSASLDQARLDQALGPGKMSNINVIQEPSPAIRETTQRKKIMGVVLVGAVLVGIGLAFLIELLLDPSIKRPSDLETKLNQSVFMTIPRMEPKEFRKARAKKRRRAGEKRETTLEPAITYAEVSWNAGKGEAAPWDPEHPMRPHFEALRDRLIADFELKNMTHKPKLVAVTGCSPGSGVSTLATGLAASLSETGGGNVLLVDMNGEQGAAHPIYRGKPGACGLPDALEQDKRNTALMQENLYVVSASQPDDRLPRVLPRRFTHLVPKMKASDYDYIIFDMPTANQTSLTARLAGFMDAVLLVVQSEKTHRGLVKQASTLLAQSNANVSTVLNKYHKYVPAVLDQEL